ncbi:unnamed protein product [Adineta steineri]|uniref:Pentapeptide repeat-containing protein n=1 Tax=Adineta steineri TaxID=433720 RepID=A0A815PN75_9BILA|nr:unnamed protein product [Adineta steineri]
MVDFNKRSFWSFTFKDILAIISSVAIPIALAIYTSIGSAQQKQQAEKKQQFDFAQSKELRQQTLYDEFINNIYKLDKDGYLNDIKNPWAFANAYYRAAHRQWDTIRKADVIQFLKEKQLIGRNNCTNGCKTTKLDDIIRLSELNFDKVHLVSETGILNKLNLQCTSFEQVSMSNAEFTSVNLNGVSFDGARLDKAKFVDSSLLCASFIGANLTEQSEWEWDENDHDHNGEEQSEWEWDENDHEHNDDEEEEEEEETTGGEVEECEEEGEEEEETTGGEVEECEEEGEEEEGMEGEEEEGTEDEEEVEECEEECEEEDDDCTMSSYDIVNHDSYDTDNDSVDEWVNVANDYKNDIDH